LPFTASFAHGSVFDHALIDVRSGQITFKVTGKNAWKTFIKEAGGHRWQRVPPTEKRGRVHTSTITVAVLKEPEAAEVYINPDDLDIKTCRGSGAGGQHRNVTDSAVQIAHAASGITVRCESERSQHANREQGLALLRAKLLRHKKEALVVERNEQRQEHVGQGRRGEKIRTVRVQDNVVVNHQNHKRIPYKKYQKGDLLGLQ
jgi:peptide chain release factor 1